MDIQNRIAVQLNIPPKNVRATIELLDDDNTVPFIARYRKELTGDLDEEQIRILKSNLDSLRAIAKRRETILKSIDEQGKLSNSLKDKLLEAATLTELEDLYQPYKPKRKTRASLAREKGYQPMADLILAQPKDKDPVNQLATKYAAMRAGSASDVLAGARDIVAEIIGDNPQVRQRTRNAGQRWGILRCARIKESEDPRGKYRLYYSFQSRVNRLQPHQILAINRGEQEKILRVKVEIPEEEWRKAITYRFRPEPASPLASQLRLASDDAAKRLLLPAIERDIRRNLTDQAEEHAISLFAINLRNLLLQPPLAGFRILGIDPGFRTGCKIAVIDANGNILDTATIYPHAPQRKWQPAIEQLNDLIQNHNVGLIAIGNGTASRETEQLVGEYNKRKKAKTVQYIISNEAGASVYSASPLARSELPDMDVTLRGAVSIARRVQDPLAELVKIDPRSIGVGLYQHDVNQGLLRDSLEDVVESVVNQVGVEVNTASPSLLTYVSGIGPKLAENIVAYRSEHGPILERQSLLSVPGLGPKSFEQAAGFLRIRDGKNSLDASAIHPESYPVAEAILRMAGLDARVPPRKRAPALLAYHDRNRLRELSEDLGAGIPTLQDILEQLVDPGRDPRNDLAAPILRSDVLGMEDLKPGMRLVGTVRNVVDFGSFIDIGVKQDGLLHRSQVPKGKTLAVGDIIDVKIIKVEAERSRISLGWVD